jgi:hypothetical protein
MRGTVGSASEGSFVCLLPLTVGARKHGAHPFLASQNRAISAVVLSLCPLKILICAFYNEYGDTTQRKPEGKICVGIPLWDMLFHRDLKAHPYAKEAVQRHEARPRNCPLRWRV